MPKTIKKEARYIKLNGILLQTGEYRIKDKLIGPFKDYSTAIKWIERNGFEPVDSDTVTKFVRKNPGFLNTVVRCSGEADIFWAEIKFFDEDPKHSNVSAEQKNVKV